MARAEHIHIEAEPEALPTPARPLRRKVRTAFSLSSRLRGCDTQVSILEEHFASVRSVRPNSEQKSYDFDLRFALPKPIRSRHVSWFWLSLALCLAALGGGAIWLLTSRSATDALVTNPAFIVASITLLAAIGAVLMFLRRTTESLEFVSVHGGATLLSVTGGIGSARTGKTFFVELIKSINAAKAARPQPLPQFLRDEMREHHRLRELGVLSEEQYEASKARILAAH